MHHAFDKKLVRFGGSQRAPPVNEKLQQKVTGHVLGELVLALTPFTLKSLIK